MSDISSIAGLPATYDPQGSAEVDETAGELGRQSFLNLLTVQLQNQDPLNPIKNEDFVAQLATFSSLEQLIGIQESTDAVYTGIAAMNNSTMTNMLGRDVVALGNQNAYTGPGDDVFHFQTGEPMSGGKIVITNENGTVVHTAALGANDTGENSYTWDGLDQNGQQVADGIYTFSVTATNSDGGDLPVDELIVGTVTEMDYSSGIPVPSIEGIAVDLTLFLRITVGAGA
ncbi:MAG: hypothetical protein GWP91_12615 [Rhodobacterales bacterium]|nr:hypothetical protein [Rhodobacterales bacterium]